MKVLGLISGGKDSCYNLMLCEKYGHEIVALGNLCPQPSLQQEDLDSWMFQTVGHQLIEKYSSCTGIPLYRAFISGMSLHRDMSYTQTPGDEVEDLFRLIAYVKTQIPELEGVSCGAIASDYQRIRVENICARLHLTSLAFMWRKHQLELLDEMIASGIEAILVKVAVMGLSPSKDLGKSLTQMRSKLLYLSDNFGINICGEGGEYETLVLDSPLFKYASIQIDGAHVIQDSVNHDIVANGIWSIHSFHLECKDTSVPIPDAQIISVPSSFEFEVVKPKSYSKSIDLQMNMHPSADFLRIEVIPQTKEEFSILVWNVFHRIRERLEEYQLSFNDVVFVSLFLSDISNFSLLNEIYSQVFPLVNPPSRACIQVAPCTHAITIEVLCQRKQNCKKVLHVQSRSSWAPSCVGPYSQTTSIKHLTFMSGTLGLIPETMSLKELQLKEEMKLALKHCQSIAIASGTDFHSLALKIVIFISSKSLPLLKGKVKEDMEKLLESSLPNFKWYERSEIQNYERPKKLRDSYLNSVETDISFCPLISFVSVPALPKGANVEVLPVLLNPSSHLAENFCYSEIQSPVPLENSNKTILQKSKLLGINATCSTGEIDLPEGWIRPRVRIMDCGAIYCAVQIMLQEIPDDLNTETESMIITITVQYLNQWLKKSFYTQENLYSVVLWYTTPQSYCFLTRLEQKLNWLKGNKIPVHDLGTDLNFSITGMYEMQFTIL